MQDAFAVANINCILQTAELPASAQQTSSLCSMLLRLQLTTHASTVLNISRKIGIGDAAIAIRHEASAYSIMHGCPTSSSIDRADVLWLEMTEPDSSSSKLFITSPKHTINVI